MCWWALSVSELLRVQREADLKLERIKEAEERLEHAERWAGLAN